MSPTGLRTKVAAPLLEVFASLQGEGAYVGEPQVLVRLRGCPLRCRWCDTPGSWTLDASAPAHLDASAPAHLGDGLARGGDRTRPEPGWATPFQVACRVAEVEPGPPRSVSVTGGEPLMWPDFVLGLRAVLGPRRLHLETAGGHPDALERVLPACDHVSYDLKLPADLGPPVPLRVPAGVEDAPARFERSPRDAQDWRAARARDLPLLRGRDAALKLVVAGGRRAEEFEELLADAARLAGELPLVVQPVSPRAGIEAPSPDLLEEVVELARELRLAVRVVPQVHRLLGLP